MKTKIIFLILFAFCSRLLNSQTLLADYNFTGATGNDNSGNGNTGTIYGASTTGNVLVIGSNTSDYFVIPASLLTNKLDFSISYKIKFTDFNLAGNFPTNHIISGDNPGLEGAVAMSYQKNVNLWRFALNGSLYDFSDNTVTTNQWYCITISRDVSGTLKLYINGIQHPSVYNNTSQTYITSLLLGQETDCTGSCFDVTQCTYGMIDDFKIYTGAVNQSTITSNCNLACVAPPNPVNITAPANLSVCANTSATLTASGSGTLQWFFSNVSQAVAGTGINFITPSLAPGSYTFYVGAVTCTPSVSRTAIEVTVLALPTLSVNSGAICSGQSFSINCLGVVSYTVSGGSSVVNPATTGSYIVTGTNAQGCMNTAISTITVNAPPTLTLSGPSNVCIGANNNLLAFGAITYTWSTGSNQPFLVMSPTVNTTYSVTGANGPGCSGTATFSVTVNSCDGLQSYNRDSAPQLKLYPNPAGDVINVETTQPSSFNLINDLGQIVLSGTFTNGINFLNLSGLPHGIYVLKLNVTGKPVSEKILKMD